MYYFTKTEENFIQDQI